MNPRLIMRKTVFLRTGRQVIHDVSLAIEGSWHYAKHREVRGPREVFATIEAEEAIFVS